jgi:hypothetical protein
VRYGVGDTVHQPTPDPPQPSIDNFLPRDSLPVESCDGGSYVNEIAEEVEEAETEESLYIQQQLANVVCKKVFLSKFVCVCVCIYTHSNCLFDSVATDPTGLSADGTVLSPVTNSTCSLSSGAF